MSARKRVGVPSNVNGSVKGTQESFEPKTDLLRWRLKSDRGCHTWHYLSSDEEVKEWPISVAERWYLGLDTVREHVKSSTFAILSEHRICQHFQRQRHLYKHVRMVSPSTLNYSFQRVTGVANMADRCFCSQVS